MFGIGMPELLIILVVALLVLGPKRLPDAARSLGRGLAEFRRASTDLQRSLTTPIDEIKETVDEATREPPARPPRADAEPAEERGGEPEKKPDG